MAKIDALFVVVVIAAYLFKNTLESQTGRGFLFFGFLFFFFCIIIITSTGFITNDYSFIIQYTNSRLPDCLKKYTQIIIPSFKNCKRYYNFEPWSMESKAL